MLSTVEKYPLYIIFGGTQVPLVSNSIVSKGRSGIVSRGALVLLTAWQFLPMGDSLMLYELARESLSSQGHLIHSI